ncbi:malonate decarboxylase holo-[acyl-carrier-protein] synthase [Aquabacterium sp.]|uniref:malonate decarboxylase holo-[acyl-carrier-protein] synthase n=1 Tax=Aquabacterium sp. TaxID=1872578 RepID=UPI0037830A8B
MTPLHRHQLVRLQASGWRALRAQAAQTALQPCLALWEARGLPLVVGCQGASAQARSGGELRLGLAAPIAWQRQRLALRVDRSQVGWFDEFPLAARIEPMLPRPLRASWQRLCDRLQYEGAVARVYGSHGWQALTGLPYLHPGSDIDLWITVQDADHADAIAALLEAQAYGPMPRLDGELCFPDGSAVAWREWRPWRSGAVRQVLVKDLGGAWLLDAGQGAARLGRRERAAA